MALPPEHIRIKRRREEEPVETLYIQSDSLHHSKRRFTDFVFQRVVRNKDGTIVAGTSSAGSKPSHQHQPQAPVNVSGHSVPLVRSTKPGEEYEERCRPQGVIKTVGGGGMAGISDGGTSAAERAAVFSMNPPRVRRFHLDTLAVDDEPEPDYISSRFSHRVGAGVQKRRVNKPSQRVVVIEKKVTTTEKSPTGATATTTTKTGPALEDLTSMIGSIKVSNDVISEAQKEAASTVTSPPRKRHVINEAERRWREEGKARRRSGRPVQDSNRRPMKTGDSVRDDPSTWNYDSEQLAEELAEIAMQMTGDLPSSPATRATEPAIMKTAPPPARSFEPTGPKPKLKYQPRLPKNSQERHSRPGSSNAGPSEGVRSGPADHEAMEIDTANNAIELAQPTDSTVAKIDDDSDSGYVYDEFVRRPLHEVEADPWLKHVQGNRWDGIEVPRDIGVVVITNEDAHYWDALLEDEEEREWETEDEDSNAEDNPANEYPDEDLSFDDEFDDVNAAYRKFRRYASDDEEFDVNDYDEYGYPMYRGDYSDEDHDDDDDDEEHGYRRRRY
ncbi:hypothetical protein VTO42DRAFT_8845 [Malbranchea cinnamomea]